jgi:AcrR family transcriptional regulator
VHTLPIRSGAEPDSELDRRTRRKLRTRRALEEAALQLFAEQGYETTTVAQIAERADVGKRTFHFHFPTKEDVLFTSATESFGELSLLVRAAPREIPDMAAIEQAILSIHNRGAYDPVEHRLTDLLVRAAETSAVVRGKQMEHLDLLRQTFIEALALRHKEQRPSRSTVISGGIATQTFHLAVVHWSRMPTHTLLAPIVQEWFRTLGSTARDSTRFPTG